MNKTTCKKIADLAVNIGVNIQKGQDAVIFVSTRNSKLARYIAEACYQKGARKVSVEFKDEEFQKIKYLNEDLKTLSKMERWESLKIKQRSERLPVLIHVDDDDPDAFNGIDVDKMTKANIARGKRVKKYRDYEFLYNQWTIIAVPSPKWAKKVFPNESSSVAQQKLLDVILKTTRLDGENPVKDWEKHITYLKEKAKKLNDLNLDYLIYKSKNGTDLKLHLQPNHVWLSARSKSLQNIEYSANMPTEEIFTMPKRDGVDGVVVSTKPLSHNGKVIEDFKIYFEKGRIIKVEAKVNQEVLEKAIDTDEGSHYLGEVALVPFDSPINQTGLLFYNTLFDENACCHLAFGQAFEDNLKGYENMTKEEMKQLGFNESLTHVDFMIGSEDLEIIGIDYNKKEHQIFKNGVWAI